MSEELPLPHHCCVVGVDVFNSFLHSAPSIAEPRDQVTLRVSDTPTHQYTNVRRLVAAKLPGTKDRTSNNNNQKQCKIIYIAFFLIYLKFSSFFYHVFSGIMLFYGHWTRAHGHVFSMAIFKQLKFATLLQRKQKKIK